MTLIDFTVIAALLIEGPQSQAARRALASDNVWVSAPIWRQQLLDALAEHMILDGMTLTTVLQKLAAADFTTRTSHEVLLDEQILGLSLESQVSASQAIYILTARKLGTKLVTADIEIITRFPLEAVSIDSFISE